MWLTVDWEGVFEQVATVFGYGILLWSANFIGKSISIVDIPSHQLSRDDPLPPATQRHYFVALVGLLIFSFCVGFFLCPTTTKTLKDGLETVELDPTTGQMMTLAIKTFIICGVPLFIGVHGAVYQSYKRKNGIK